MSSLCSRFGCGQPAVSWLVIDPRECRAWLADPGSDRVLGAIPLCGHHARTRTVPVGWDFADKRSPEGLATAELSLVVGAEAADASPDDPAHAVRAEVDTGAEPVELAVVPDDPVPAGSMPDDGVPDDGVPDAAPPTPVNRPDPEFDAPTLWPSEDEAAESAVALDVDESTPMLSRAFRAAHVE